MSRNADAPKRLSRRSTTLDLLAVVVASFFCITSAHAEPDCDFTDAPTDRPQPSQGPTQVKVAVYVLDVLRVDSVAQEFVADFYIEASWRDPRLGARVREAGAQVCEVQTADIWRPGFQPINALSFESRLPDVARVQRDGTVAILARVFGNFVSRFDLVDFPLDDQAFTIELVSVKKGPTDIELVMQSVGSSPQFSEPGWKLRLGSVGPSEYRVEMAGAEGAFERSVLTRLVIEIKGRRHVSFYTWKVLIPLSLIVIASWSVFWIDPMQFGPQTGIATAMMLTVVAFLFSLQMLPTVPYLTRLDYFIYGCLVLVFAALVEAMTSCNLAMRGREETARRLDRICRGVFPLAFGSVLGWFWWLPAG